MNIGTVTKTHRIPPKMAQELRALASKHGTSENHEMTVALRAHLDASRRAS
jgi:hypothetical protein